MSSGEILGCFCLGSTGEIFWVFAYENDFYEGNNNRVDLRALKNQSHEPESVRGDNVKVL